MAAAAFKTRSAKNRKKSYSPGQLIFGHGMILQIKHEANWVLIRQRKHTQTNRDNTLKNRHRFDYNYKFGDNVMIAKHTAYTYETPYKGPFVITQCFPNGTVNLKCGAIKIKYNIRRIKPYKSDITVEDSNSKDMSDYIRI